MNTYHAMWNTATKEVMDAIDAPDHHRQVAVFGQGHSYVDFVRRLVAVGVESRDDGKRDPYARAVRDLSWSTEKEPSQNDREIAFAEVAAPLPCVARLTYGTGSTVLPVGLTGAHLLPDVPGKRPKHYTLLQLLVHEGMVGFEVHRPPVLRYGREVHPDVVIGQVYEEGVEGDRTWVAVFPGPQMLTSSDHPDRDAALRVLLAHHTGGDQ